MEQRETAGITIRLIIEQTRRERGESGVRALLDLAQETRPLEVLENARTWHSFTTRRRFFEAGTQLTGDPLFAKKVGTLVISSRASTLLRMLFSRFGSPRALLKALPVVQSKFDTACESRLASQRDGSALVEFRTKPAYEASPYDCLYAMGLFSQLPVLFGMPEATVVQSQCQADGAEHCTFDIRWDSTRLAHSRFRLRGSRLPAVTDLVEMQLEDLQATVADLLDTRDVGEVIQKVTGHAGSAVAAQQLLLAVRLVDGSAIEVGAEGFTEATALGMGTALLETGTLPPWGGGEGGEQSRVLLADVHSARRDYGKLVAFSSAPFVEGEQQLLDAYARLAATALDTTVALGIASTRQQTAEVLGEFASRLIRVQDTAGISAVTVEAAREIVSSDRSVVFRHVEEDGSLVTDSALGYHGPFREQLDALVITAEDTPELSKLLRSPEVPLVYDRSNADEYLLGMMETFELEAFAAVSIRSGERLFGVLTVAWESGFRPNDVPDLIRRLAAIADQAAGAWEKALLLEQINRQASIDALTGLANRRVFTELLASLLAKRDGPPLAVLFCDLDRFKGVNDMFGHAAGDELLVAVGRRLQHSVRSDDLVARLGGDEFTVLLTGVGTDWSPEIFAAKVREAMTEPVEIEGSQVVVHLSIGAIVASPGKSSVKDVLRCADAAMYVAKARGGDRLLTFEGDMLIERSERVELEASLAVAAADPAKFVVLYQPQVEITSGQVVGAEALVRWEHPTLGLLAPDRFLAVAEETGHVVPIDLHVLRSALTEVAMWRRKGFELRVAVNFSARTLTSPDLVCRLEAELAEAGVPGRWLEIELTESTAVADPEALSQILLSLGRLDVSVAIDDVGTGYSSLALLHKLPAQRIKIDRSFVQRINEDPASRSVVEAVLLLADRLGQSVVAEGIETEEQALELKALGCDLGQGYLFARPGSSEELMCAADEGLRCVVVAS